MRGLSQIKPLVNGSGLLTAGLIATAGINQAHAEPEGVMLGERNVKYNITTSLWTTHFSPRDEHNNTQNFIGFERHTSNFITTPLQNRIEALQSSDPLLGIAHFRNSYDQNTIYAYAGLTKSVWEHQELIARVKITAGLIHGYRGEYQHKIPFNHLGIAPAAIPSVTLHYRQFNTEVILFGTSGLMLNVGYSF